MLGKAAVAIWCDVAFEIKDEFDDWHAHEHMPERLSIPGFLRGTRWVSTDGRNAYCMLYEAQSEATVTGGAYLDRLNDPTPWSRKMMAHHRNMARSLCRVQSSFGAGLGQFLLSLRCTPDPQDRAGLETWLCKELLPGIPSQKGFMAAHFLQNIAAPGATPTAEQKLRGGDAAADWIVLISGYSAEALEAIMAAEVNDQNMAAHGARPGSIVRCYGLACLMIPGDVRPRGAS